MEGILLLLTCLLAGAALRAKTGEDGTGAKVLNQLIIYFFLPLLALFYVPGISFQWNVIWLTLTPFIIFGASVLIYQLLAPLLGFDRNTKAALMLTSGIGSTSFVGFPVFELLYGEAGLAYGVLLSLGGTILVFNTAGLGLLFYYTNAKQGALKTIEKIIFFPPFTTFLIAVMMNITGMRFPDFLQTLLGKLVAPFSVIALISIGMQIKLSELRGVIRPLLIGQFVKLILMPLLVYFLFWHLLDQRDLVAKVCILGAAIGSMSSISILSAERGLNPRLSLMMPAVGIPLSIPFLYAIDYYLL